MSMTNTQKNIASTMQDVAKQQLALTERMDALSVMWTNEGMQSLSDAEWQELAEFSGVTATEALACKGAFDAVATTMGNYTAGTNRYKMLKIINTVP